MSNRKIKKDRQKKSVLSRLIRFISDIIKDWKNDSYKQIRDSFSFDLVLTAIAIINDDLKIRVTVLVIAILITFLIPRLTGPIYSWWYSKRPEGIIIESKSQELTLTEKGRSEVYGHIHNEYRIKGNPKKNTEFPST
ncbi:MAG: hypothetical protein E7Z62_05530 [Thermoplasmata archaeon]|nr:hypothetical protein [Thermoplasmata archaeon]